MLAVSLVSLLLAAGAGLQAAGEVLFPKELLEARTVEEIQAILARYEPILSGGLPLTRPHHNHQQQQPQGHQGDASSDADDRLRHRRAFFLPEERSDHTVAATYGFSAGGFYHSVASGDPTQDSVILWTRYTPVSAEEEVTLEFRMAEIQSNSTTNDPTLITDDSLLDPARNPNLRRGRVTVTRATDFVAKIDVTGLPSGTHFAYVFLVVPPNPSTSSAAVIIASDIGLTRTAPAPDDPGANTLTYAHFSCAQFLNGFFHPYDIASTIQGLDLAVFVGDYIYEYGSYSTGGTDAIDQRLDGFLPLWETIDLQDYRNRYASHSRDEGLQNLMRRVPIMAIWDDHELSDNASGDDNRLVSANHNPICPVGGDWFPDAWQSTLQCDRNEGDILDRYKAAAQAFWEWLPVRHVPGTMGKIKSGQLTKIMEWGSLATVVGFDTRLSYRSHSYPTESALTTPNFIAAALFETNVAKYKDPTSFAAGLIRPAKEADEKERESESYTIIGEPNLNLLQRTFEASKADQKPWQIFISPVMVGESVLPDVSELYLEATNEEFGSRLKSLVDGFLPSLSGAIFRLAAVLASQSIPFPLDDFSGFRAEKRKLIEMFQNSANNVVVLGGDLHIAFGYVLETDSGIPVAVNIGSTSVSAPNQLDGIFLGAFEEIIKDIGEDAFFKIVGKTFTRQMPYCKVASLHIGGFTASKVTKDSHTAEWFHVSKDDRISNYATARARAGNGALTARAVCSDSATTLANEPGSLRVNQNCSAIQLVTERPAVFGIPVPAFMDEEESSIQSESFIDCGMLGCTFPKRNPPPSQAPTPDPDADIFDIFLIGPFLRFLSYILGFVHISFRG